jgi:hypothetical protein
VATAARRRLVTAIGTAHDSARGERKRICLADVERGHVEGNGTYYGSFQLAGISLGTARAGHAVSLIGNKLYVIGGANAGGALDSVEVATLVLMRLHHSHRSHPLPACTSTTHEGSRAAP